MESDVWNFKTFDRYYILSEQEKQSVQLYDITRSMNHHVKQENWEKTEKSRNSMQIT